MIIDQGQSITLHIDGLYTGEASFARGVIAAAIPTLLRGRAFSVREAIMGDHLVTIAKVKYHEMTGRMEFTVG